MAPHPDTRCTSTDTGGTPPGRATVRPKPLSGGPFRVLQQVHQCGTGPGDPRPDRPDRATTQLGRLRVRETDELGEDECLAAFGGQGGQQIGEGDAVFEARQTALLSAFGGILPVVDVGETRPGRRVAVVVDHRSAGDGQQPDPGGGAALETVQAAQGPQEGVLCEVVGGLRVGTEVRNEAPDVSVQGATNLSTASGSPPRAVSAQAVTNSSAGVRSSGVPAGRWVLPHAADRAGLIT